MAEIITGIIQGSIIGASLVIIPIIIGTAMVIAIPVGVIVLNIKLCISSGASGTLPKGGYDEWRYGKKSR